MKDVEDRDEWKEVLCSWIRRVNVRSVPPQETCRFGAILSKLHFSQN